MLTWVKVRGGGGLKLLMHYRNNEAPSSVEFACALLREVLVALSEPSVLREKAGLQINHSFSL